MEANSTSVKLVSINVVRKAIAPYKENWKKWLKSGASFLSPKEQKILGNYLLYENHNKSSEELKISYVAAEHVLCYSVKKLQENVVKYYLWLAEEEIKKSGAAKYSSTKKKFLYAPLYFLPISHELRRSLCYTGEENMNALLQNYSEARLCQLPLFGKTALNELKQHLRKRGCLKMLKQ